MSVLTRSAILKARWTTCELVPTQHGTQLGQTKKSTFEDITLGIAFHTSPDCPKFAPFGNAIELIIIAKEIVGKPLDIPDSLYWHLIHPYLSRFLEPFFCILDRKLLICHHLQLMNKGQKFTEL